MSYEKTTWLDQDVENPRTYSFRDNGDGTTTILDAFGNVTELGTPVNAENMNKIEQGIFNATPRHLGTGIDIHTINNSGIFTANGMCENSPFPNEFKDWAILANMPNEYNKTLQMTDISTGKIYEDHFANNKWSGWSELSWNPNTASAEDKATVTGWGMPDYSAISEFDTAERQTFTMPYNGYILSCVFNSGGGLVLQLNNSSGAYVFNNSSVSNVVRSGMSAYFPKGTVLYVKENVSNVLARKIMPLQGEV